MAIEVSAHECKVEKGDVDNLPRSLFAFEWQDKTDKQKYNAHSL